MASLIAFHILQYISFSYLIKKIKFTFWFVNLTIVGFFIWGVADAGDVKCEPFLSNYISLDIIVSGLAFVDYLIEYFLEELKRSVIGLNVLKRYHEDVEFAF